MLKRWRLMIVGLVAACAVVVAFGGPAFALQGEDGFFNVERAGNVPITSQDGISEARSDQNSGNTLVQVWRGGEDNQVWASVNGGNQFHIANDLTTQTFVAPRVVWNVAQRQFFAFQTGIDSRIYYSFVSDGETDAGTRLASLPGQWSAWQAIPNQTTIRSVSPAASPAGLLLGYLSSTGTQLYSTWLPQGRTAPSGWDPGIPMGPIHSQLPPSLAYNPVDFHFVAVWSGIDDDITWTATQPLGQTGQWLNITSLSGPETVNSPSIGIDSRGNILIAITDLQDRVDLITSQGNSTSGWVRESVGITTVHDPWITVLQNVFYLIVVNGEQGPLLAGTAGDKRVWAP